MTNSESSVDPLEGVCICLLVCSMTGNNGAYFTVTHGIESMEDFRFMEPNNEKEVIKIYNDQNVCNKMGLMVQKKPQAFLHWYHSKCCEQEEINATDFDKDAPKGTCKRMLDSTNLKDSSSITV